MSKKERDQLQVLHEVGKRQMTQREAAEQVAVTERWVRKLLARIRKEGDRAVIHRLRGRRSNRRIPEGVRKKAVGLVRQEYRDFGPTLASEYLAERHDLAAIRTQGESRVAAPDYTVQVHRRRYQIARETVRAGLREARVRMEQRLDGSVAVRFREHSLPGRECETPPPAAPPRAARAEARRSEGAPTGLRGPTASLKGGL